MSPLSYVQSNEIEPFGARITDTVLLVSHMMRGGFEMASSRRRIIFALHSR